ncbi:GDSL esterase/lipase At4g10955-like [Chenopodium quinoa]|uniref:GDSL esterase/lipase At4g10955-like n=1 Tax=Chenopodium quinoa TaxID=63459 RepID=UPI000B77D10D|nr:GDSL esterase/lipase At4g10955-like [Chenopodium quinoa]
MKGYNKEEEKETKPSEKEIFGICGPLHLNCVDWRIPDHRRSVAASLVQGVYILERDRQQKRTGYNALAPIWWDYFHFKCTQILVDQVDSSTFGAIFVYKYHNPNYYHPMASQCVPPQYVIAFRGTITKPDTRKRDLYLDIQLALNGLTCNSRYQTALQAVENLMVKVGQRNVWLAGHSLGAAIALQVGKELAKRGCYIESYLFNPPYTSAPIETLNNPNLKTGARIATSVITAGLTLALNKGTKNKYTTQQHGPFTILSSWIPYLFVNPKDPICCEYIGYFEHREKMEGWGIGGIERIATKNSVVGLLSGALGREGEALHLIPSAFVVKNMIVKEQGLKISHGIHQWWEPHPFWQPQLYKIS